MERLDLDYSDERFQSKINEDLHCPICMNVLKDPVHCGPNEHYFCKKCITAHIKNSQKCPSCNKNLSLDTLKPPSRFVRNMLSQLIINCDNLDRGCQKFVKLGGLSDHVKCCRFAPVQCSNKGCIAVVSRGDYEQHVKNKCDFRERCVDCDDLRKELEKVKGSLTEVTEKLQRVCETKEDTEVELKAGDYVRQDFIIMGGCEAQNRALDCVDIFHWSKNAWESLKPLKKGKVKACSFVYDGKVIISGGVIPDPSQPSKTRLCNKMEALSIGEEGSSEWSTFAVKLPTKRSAHKCLVYQDRLLVIGGYDDKQGKYANAIHEVRLQPPFSSQVVNHMPCRRRYFGAEIFGDKVVIVGGTATGLVDTCLSNVLEYDIKNNNCRNLPSLPFKVTGMATVAWQGKIVLIGGVNKDGERLNSIVLYDVETGKSTMLPSMKHKRGGASAVVTGNVIVVMGGVNDTGRLNSVECFSFYTYSWDELPPMKKGRSYASAVVIP